MIKSKICCYYSSIFFWGSTPPSFNNTMLTSFRRGSTTLQGVFFNWSPPKFSKYKYPYNPWHLEKLWASLHGILYLENLGGLQLKKTPCILTTCTCWKKEYKDHLVKKHCENLKTLPREHLIGCQDVKIFLLKDTFKLFFLFLINWDLS